uniref:Uncharacterized protein n=1 Tax=Candidatus Kentrum sp. UNK TaxID=2126344 RepID=A0A451B1R3_9GAMM|nr:MAG: hypothetical protein BECKUNK1418G_GA0071005_11091 [Candidatus Kentron sp. UNK]VFK72223.1 MAG: hypothetical protein BECKUNK1418H_GA0071006_11021 [Candidatus Kentron sp. UNK]
MARKKKTDTNRPIESYRHQDKRRVNNPPVGLVTSGTDPDDGAKKKTYAFDPHLDPEMRWDGRPDARLDELLANLAALATEIGDAARKLEAALGESDLKRARKTQSRLDAAHARLRETERGLLSLRQPYLAWAGKAERLSFPVPTVSLHVHERIDPRAIIEAVRKRSAGVSPANGNPGGTQLDLPLFDSPRENLPLHQAIDFYRHPHGWSNRAVNLEPRYRSRHQSPQRDILMSK